MFYNICKETSLNAIFQWDGICILQTADVQEEVCIWCPIHSCDIFQLLIFGDQLCVGSSQSIRKPLNYYFRWKIPFINNYLEGEHFGWKYELLSITPDWDNDWRCGVTILGLCQETSFQPRSSAIITTEVKIASL